MPHRLLARRTSGVGSGPARHLADSPPGPIQLLCGPLDICTASIHICCPVVSSKFAVASTDSVMVAAFAGATICRAVVANLAESDGKSTGCSLIVAPVEVLYVAFSVSAVSGFLFCALARMVCSSPGVTAIGVSLIPAVLVVFAFPVQVRVADFVPSLFSPVVVDSVSPAAPVAYWVQPAVLFSNPGSAIRLVRRVFPGFVPRRFSLGFSLFMSGALTSAV